MEVTGIGSKRPKNYVKLPPNKSIQKCDGVDIYKKSSARKGKFLFAFPGLITAYNDNNSCSNNTSSSQSQSQSQSQTDACAAEIKTSQTSGNNAMKLGTLDQLDTLEPVLYVDFPIGRLKMEGRIIYPKNRYLTLQFSQSGKNVVCQDIFDKIVVFPKVYWIGTTEENPEENPMDLPTEITLIPSGLENVQENVFFRGGADYDAEMSNGAERSGKRSVTPTGRRTMPAISDENSGEDNSSSQATRTVSSRQASIKAKKQIEEVVIDDSEDEDKVSSDLSGDENSEDSTVEKILKTPNVSKKKQESNSSQVKQRKLNAWSGQSDHGGDDDDAVLTSLPRRTPQRRAARSTTSYAVDDDDGEVEEEDEEEEEEEEDEEKSVKKKKTSKNTTPSNSKSKSKPAASSTSKHTPNSAKKPSGSKTTAGKRSRGSASADSFSSQEELALELDSDEDDWTPTAKKKKTKSSSSSSNKNKDRSTSDRASTSTRNSRRSSIQKTIVYIDDSESEESS